MATRAVLWDLGNVLLDWSPNRLYRKIFSEEEEVRFFLSHVCTMQWHGAHDRGVSMAANRLPLIAQYPHYADAILAWETRWDEMFDGAIEGSVRAFEQLDARGIPQYALSNMPGEVWPGEQKKFPFLRMLKDAVISAEEGVIKPDQRIYEIAAQRIPHAPADVVFFDDRHENVEAARAFGFDAKIYTDEAQLVADLKLRKLLP
jgi:FMN phosphatase YigB (HAD superfamily)